MRSVSVAFALPTLPPTPLYSILGSKQRNKNPTNIVYISVCEINRLQHWYVSAINRCFSNWESVSCWSKFALTTHNPLIKTMPAILEDPKQKIFIYKWVWNGSHHRRSHRHLSEKCVDNVTITFHFCIPVSVAQSMTRSCICACVCEILY